MPAEDVVWKDTKLKSSKYLNNMIEQEQRGVKARILRPCLALISSSAAMTIAGIELFHRIRKGQFHLRRLGVQGQAAAAIWTAVLSA